MAAARELIECYFKERQMHLKRIEKLAGDPDYIDVTFAFLCCMIDELSLLKYSKQIKPSSDRFKKLLHEYSEIPEFRLVDLLYFLQWPANDYLEYNSYTYWKKLKKFEKEYDFISNNLSISDIETIKNNPDNRYVSIDSILDSINVKDKKYFSYLNHFTTTNVLYHFGRCTSVHEGYTILLQKNYNENGKCSIKSNYIITPTLLIESIRSMNGKLKNECIEENKVPIIYLKK